MIVNSASAWALQLNKEVLLAGRPLNQAEIKIASAVGVNHPENIRLLELSEIPEPTFLGSDAFKIKAGLSSAYGAGLSVGYAVLIKTGMLSKRLLAHEFRHVYQFEICGSIESMTEKYLKELAYYGYLNAPMEVDAIKSSMHF